MHFTPFFYILSPFVYLGSGLFFYLIVHALAFAASVWVYHKFAEQVLGAGALAVLSYLTLMAKMANLNFMASNLYPHFEAFMALGLMGFAFFAVRGQFWMALLCLLMALTIKEDVWIYGIATSCLLLGRVSARHAAVYLMTSVAYYVLVPLLAGWRFLPAVAVLYLWVNSTDMNRSSLAFYFNLPSVVLYVLTLPFALINLEHFWGWLRERFPTIIPARTAAQMSLFVLMAVNVVSQVRRPLSLMQSPSG